MTDSADMTAAPRATKSQGEVDAHRLLRKYDLLYDGLTHLSTGQNTTWRVEGTPYLLRVAPESTSGAALMLNYQLANILNHSHVGFVSPAFPLAWQVMDDTRPVRGTLWFYEAPTGEALDYHALGKLVRAMQEHGTAAVRGSSLQLPHALDVETIETTLLELREYDILSVPEFTTLAGWLPRLARTTAAFRSASTVLVHDDLWPKNMLMTDRGLLLCDPDNMGWGPTEYDLAFLARALESKVITRSDVSAFERGYGGRIPDINTAWRLALFHRLRWVCCLAERRTWDKAAGVKLAAELALWQRRRGPQP